MIGTWSLDFNPGYALLDMLSRTASPYDLNPWGLNPLRDVVQSYVDFDKVTNCDALKIFIQATNVETGRARVFQCHEITLDVVMASACLS